MNWAQVARHAAIAIGSTFLVAMFLYVALRLVVFDL